MNQKQTYTYENNDVKVLFSTNKVFICKNDLLIINVSVLNKSHDSLYFFKEMGEGFIGWPDSLKEGMILFLGNKYITTLDVPEELILVKPEEIHEWRKLYSYKEIKDLNYRDNFKIYAGIGYIDFNMEFYSKIIESKDEFYEKKNDGITLWSWNVELYLKRLHDMTLDIILK